MDKSSQHDVGFLPTFLAGAWPVVVLLACHFALGLSATGGKSVTFDEITHLTSGYSYWAANDYRMDPESGNWPQRWAALPVWLRGYRFPSLDDAAWQTGSQWTLADKFFHESGNDADAMLLEGRAMIGLLSVALGLIVYLWSRQLFGPVGGLISLTLYTFSPTMLSHGFLVTADLSTALFFTASIWALWALLHRVSWFRLAATGAALGGLLLSKFSGVLIVPMGALLLLARLWNPAPLDWALGTHRVIRGRLGKVAVFLGLLLAAALVVDLMIWLSFGFRFSMLAGDVQAESGAPDWLKNASGGLGVTHGFVQFAAEHHLLPESYLYGFCYTMLTAQQRQAFFNGEFSIHGWPTYFPYALLVKTPLEVFLLLILAGAAPWIWRSNSAQQKGQTPGWSAARTRFYSLAPLLVLLGVYWVFSLTSHLNIGHRHLLPTYPAMFILAGAAAAWFTSPATSINAQSSRKICVVAKVLVAASLLLSLAEALWIWPNYLTYFNVLAGGPQNGYRHLVDSSLDWGQDLKGLKRWLDAHPEEAQNVYLSYFGTASPQYYGIRATILPGFFNHYQTHVPEPLSAGTYCISATLLEGVYAPFPGKWNVPLENLYQQSRQVVQDYRRAANDPDALQKLIAATPQEEFDKIFALFEGLRLARLCSFLRAREPDFDIGHTILIYRLDQAEVDRATEGPPVELLPECEPDVKACLGIR